MFDCVGIGICAVDHLCLLDEYPKLDAKIEAKAYSFQGGGPVPNALVTLARLGAKTAYIGVVGDDDNGKFALEEFEQEWVDISGVVVDKNCNTNQAFIWIDRKTGQKTVVLNNNHTAELMPNELSSRHITSTRYLHLDGRETEATLAAIELAKEAGVEIVLDAGSPREQMDDILHYVDYPIVSEYFCREYLRTKNYEKALEKLLKYGASLAVVTCGKRGAYAANSAEIIYQPAFSVDVVDTTGAGDVFHGAFIFGLLQNWTLDETLKFASACAAYKCTHLGGRNGIPNLEQVKKFLQVKEGKK